MDVNEVIHSINESFRFSSRWIPKTQEEKDFAILLLNENKIREATISGGYGAKSITSGYYINRKLSYKDDVDE